MRVFLALMLVSCVAHSAPSILNATPVNDPTHANAFIAPAINTVLGSGKVDNPLFVDYTVTLSPVSASSNTGAAYTSVASGMSANHAVYQVVNFSQCCYNTSADQTNYAILLSQGTVLAQPIGPLPLPAGSAPPVVMVSASSLDSEDGTTGWGIEFGLSASYLGLDTSEDSWVSAEMAGFLDALKFNHSTFNWFDIKGALRITATQCSGLSTGGWSNGWSATGFGFGCVDWASTNLIVNASAIYLQGPGLRIDNHGYYATLTLFPFRQTRYNHDLICSVASGTTWPVKNEYTFSDLTTAGCTVLYESNGTDIEPQFIFAPAVTGMATVVAFTTDAAGHGGKFSRVETYSPQSFSLIVGTACIN